MGQWLKNILILTPVLALMGTAGYYLWLDTQTQDVVTSENAKTEVVGVLSEITANVKRKTGESLYWNNIKSQEAVFANDSVRTGNDSKAVIQLNDKSRIELAENSLIVLEKSSSQLNVDFKTGDIETKGGDTLLAIKVKDTILESKSADLKLSTDSQNNTQIIVTKGTATLTDAQKQKVELTTKKLVNVDESGKAKQIAIALVLNTPKDKSVILDPEREVLHPFTWTVLDEELKEQTLEISSDPNFEKLTFQKSGHQTLSGQLTRGTQYWRVSWKEKDGTVKYSDPREVRVEDDKRVVTFSPQNNAVLDLEPGVETVSFSWNALGEPRSFLLEVAKDAEFKILLANQTVERKVSEVNALKEGKYYWRVRAFSEDNNEIGKSSIASFTIRKLIPQVPTLVIPMNGFKWTLNDPLVFEWKPYEPAHEYKLLISRDSQQTNIVHQATQKDIKHIWKWTKADEYYWSVTALNEAGDIVGKSVLQKFEVEPTVQGPAIILKTPESQTTVNRDRKEPMDPVIFTWTVERPIAAGPFKFVISEKPDFSDALKKENIESTRFSLRLDKSANYYWRVEWTNPTDEKDKEVSIPFVMKYRVNNNLPPPTLVEPLNAAKRVLAKKSPIEFRWNKADGAVQYRFTLERESGTEQERVPVMSQIVDKEVLFSVPLEPGRYFWSVASIDQDKVEGASSLVRELIIELNKELSAPKLKPPVVK